MAARKTTIVDLFKIIDQIRERNEDDFSDAVLVFTEEFSGYLQDNHGGENANWYDMTGGLEKAKVNLQRLLDEQPVKETVTIGDYDAEITEDGITVGCQDFSFDELDRLMEAANRVRGIK
jgi:hypothetical protein